MKARLLRRIGLLIASALLSGCAGLVSDAGYLWQSVSGHLQLMGAARPVKDWLADADAPDTLKRRLALSQNIRAFASRELALPDNPSYRRYADLHRSAAVWNVVAAPAYSLTLKTWCFPVTGCVGYRGYFDEAAARALAAELKATGMEVSVYGVPAYSTLGYMNWAGGDPLLSTFINYPDGELARLIFHELAHQQIYASGDTDFNESFATAVERIGGRLWLDREGTPQARQAYADFDGRRQQFRELVRSTRKQLAALYQETDQDAEPVQGIAPSQPPGPALAAAKAQTLQDFRARYAVIRQGWGLEAPRLRGYDDWVANANNAFFGAQAAYDEFVPAFEALFEREGRDWKRFYDAVRRLAALPKVERHKALKEAHG